MGIVVVGMFSGVDGGKTAPPFSDARRVTDVICHILETEGGVEKTG